MKYRRLGSSTIEISEITFGCWELGGGQWEKQSDEINIQAIQTAFELGITTFDTAEGYGQGHSETIVGQALKGKRTECIISTKVSPNHLRANDVRSCVENSLKRLQTDYIDIYYIHWPNVEIPLEETLSEFNKLKEEGLIRAIGVSNFSIDQLKHAMELARVDVIQPEYSLLHRGIEKEIIPYCLEHSIGIMSYSSLAKGILTGVYHNGKAIINETDFRKQRRLFLPEHLEKEKELVQLVQQIAEKHDVSMAEIAIRWLLDQPAMTSAIVGTQNVQHLKNNLRAVDIELTAVELRQLNEVSSKVLESIDGK